MIAFETPVIGGRVREDGIEIEAGGAAPMTLLANLVVNSAGLHAVKVAQSIVGIPADRFVDHGAVSDLRRMLRLDSAGLAAQIRESTLALGMVPAPQEVVEQARAV